MLLGEMRPRDSWLPSSCGLPWDGVAAASLWLRREVGMGPLPLLEHREGREGSRGPRETMYIIQDTRSPEGGPERAPEMPGRAREAAPPNSAGQLQTVSHQAYFHNPLKNPPY